MSFDCKNETKKRNLATDVVDMHKSLAVRLQQDDKSAQFELYKLYSRAMYNVCMRILNNRDDAEDVLQEVFIVAFKQITNFRFESTIGAWLKKIAINRSLNFLKKRKAELLFVDDYNSVDIADLTEEIDWNDIQLSVERIHQAASLLPDGCRVIFSLFLLEGYDHGEIADILNISESTSKSQLHRAKLLIRNILSNTINKEQWETKTY